MKLKQISQLIGSVDPQARHYTTVTGDINYTKWREYEYVGQPADDEYGDGWKFQIDRYTREEYDAVAEELLQVLKQTPGLAFSYLVDYEEDSGYIHHIFDCEA